MPTDAEKLERVLDHAGPMCSPPGVALQVIRLTESDAIDAVSLTSAIGADPALSTKLLRVVNSSLFGLSGEVSNLTQAVALLGVRPLKALVLGFSLPEELLGGLPGEALRAFWTRSLTRAVAARWIAADWLGGAAPPDDAFAAALLREVGQLVLVCELGGPYEEFLRATAQAGPPVEPPGPDRLTLEQRTLGFDHLQLAGALLGRWRLPGELLEALTARVDSADGYPPPRVTPLAEAVVLAELVVQLVTAERLPALAELLHRGAAACDLRVEQVAELIHVLADQASRLAAALGTPLEAGMDFSGVLAEARDRLASLAADGGGPAADATQRSPDDGLSEALLGETHELRLAMRSFLRSERARPSTRPEGPPEPRQPPGAAADRVALTPAARERLHLAAGRMAMRCREQRRGLSLALLLLCRPKASTTGRGGLDRQTEQRRRDIALHAAKERLPRGRAAVLTLSAGLAAVLVEGAERRDAIALCREVAGSLASCPEGAGWVAHAGVATLAQAPKRFDTGRLIDGSLSCLRAAATGPSGTIKSIEVF